MQCGGRGADPASSTYEHEHPRTPCMAAPRVVSEKGSTSAIDGNSIGFLWEERTTGRTDGWQLMITRQAAQGRHHPRPSKALLA